jgi:Ca2+-binding RTX toxin-like protein
MYSMGNLNQCIPLSFLLSLMLLVVVEEYVWAGTPSPDQNCWVDERALFLTEETAFRVDDNHYELRGTDNDDCMRVGEEIGSPVVTWFGGAGNDWIDGHEGIDYIYGEGGNDILIGDNIFNTGVANGNDVIRGGDGDDHLEGGDGSDSLAGEQGNDTILGGNGNDVIWDDEGFDTIDCGNGIDTVYNREENTEIKDCEEFHDFVPVT